MRFAILAGLMATAVYAAPGEGLFERAVCNRDNCFRAVIRQDPSLTACSSYQKTTVTACATPTSAGCSPVTDAPVATPAYASVCSSAARYSSACSCNGVPGTTSTVTPAAPPASSPTFAFTLSIASGSEAGQIAEDVPANGDGTRIQFGDGTALQFKLDTDGYFHPAAGGGFIFYETEGDSGGVVKGVTQPPPPYKLKCSLGDSSANSGAFTCTRSGYTVTSFYLAANSYLYFGNEDLDMITLTWNRV